MGLFDDLKKALDTGVNNLKKSYRISIRYNPYFRKQKQELTKLKTIPEYIDHDIVQIYNELLKNTDKYGDEIKEFNEYLPNIRAHNNKIVKINNIISKFDFNSIINSPNSYCVSDFIEHLENINEIQKFSSYDSGYKEYCENVNEIIENLDVIKKQFDFLSLYDSCFEMYGDYYYTFEMKDNLISKIAPIVSVIRESKEYYDFSKIYKIDEIIHDHNESFIKKHLNDEVFNKVNGKSLSEEQRIAILKDEKSNLIIAGAGSGKTLTINGKVKYLLEIKKVDPKDILLLSFSHKSVEDLNSKVKQINPLLDVKTFHKLGLDILKNVNKTPFLVEEQFDAIIKRYFTEKMKRNSPILNKIVKYYSMYLSSNINEFKFENLGDYYSECSKNNYTTLRNLKKTFKDEYVKSFEELAIANFYFLNGIDYVYEKPYFKNLSTNEKRQYTPDFYLPEYNIYHEHYGVDKNGNNTRFTEEEAENYRNGIAWKRYTHETYGTKCLETFSWQFNEGSIFTNLEKELKSNGVVFKPLSQEEMLNVANCVYEDKNFKSFINLVKTFISLYKSRYKDDYQFDKFKQINFANLYEKQRTCLFLDIVKDVYNYYMNSIRTDKKIDFDDMILKAIDELEQTEEFNCKYIIVDEFQDISYSREKFLQKLIQKGKSQLFAVGDDWQAIYRFAGCDLNIFLNFDSKEHFGRSIISYITTTYRNSQELQNIVGPFIKANPEQYAKTIMSKAPNLDNPVKIMYHTGSRDNKIISLNHVLKQIYEINKYAKILILGRNNHDIDDYLFNKEKFVVSYYGESKIKKIKSLDFKSLEIEFCTVHGSKGLEEEYVIVLNADDSRLGFPNKTEDDELLKLVLSDKSSYKYAEERRLWYVALTRTKNYVYLMVNYNRPSVFVQEILKKCDIINPEIYNESSNIINCPHCKTGKLVTRKVKDSESEFFGCSNYPYCRYVNKNLGIVKSNGKRCPKCNDFMILKNGIYKCSNLRCKHEVFEHTVNFIDDNDLPF